MYGLDEKIIKDLKEIFSRNESIDKVILYGSRAKGNYRKGSDVDLVLSGNGLNLKTIYSIREEIDCLNLPYEFDLSIFNKINNPELLEHIQRVGIIFYQRD